MERRKKKCHTERKKAAKAANAGSHFGDTANEFGASVDINNGVLIRKTDTVVFGRLSSYICLSSYVCLSMEGQL